MKRDENGELSGKATTEEVDRLTAEQRSAQQREIVGQYLTNAVVSNLRVSAALKVGAGLRPGMLIGVVKVGLGEGSLIHTAVEQRFGFPYQEIEDRDMRRVMFEALVAEDTDDYLRVVIIDQQHKFVANIRIAYAISC